MTICPLCRSSNIHIRELEQPVFRHMDYANVGKNIAVSVCGRCGLMFQSATNISKVDVENTFKNSAYVESRQTIHTLEVPDYPHLVTRSFLQAEIISGLINKPNPRILDVGCFDGELLKELDRRYESAQLFGYDVNPSLDILFPKGANFSFATDLTEFNGPFDLICASHSLAYVRDLAETLATIRALLGPDGMFFFQGMSLQRNPLGLLLADQNYFFTSESLSSITEMAGFGKATEVGRDWFPREFCVVAKLADEMPTQEASHAIILLDFCRTQIETMAANLEAIKCNSHLGVLGTTLNAAFADSYLCKKNKFFADENTAKVGNAFRGKPVIHPSSLSENDTLILPFGQSAKSVIRKFSSKYSFGLISV